MSLLENAFRGSGAVFTWLDSVTVMPVILRAMQALAVYELEIEKKYKRKRLTGCCNNVYSFAPHTALSGQERVRAQPSLYLRLSL